MAAISPATNSTSASTYADGPPKTAPSTHTSTAAAAAAARPRRLPIRDTAQPTAAATGSTRTSSTRMNHSLRVGEPSMSMVCLPVMATTATELAMNTASTASAGALRCQRCRANTPGRSTVGSPRRRNQACASTRSNSPP